MPFGTLLPKHQVQRVLKFCHRSRQRSSGPRKMLHDSSDRCFSMYHLLRWLSIPHRRTDIINISGVAMFWSRAPISDLSALSGMLFRKRLRSADTNRYETLTTRLKFGKRCFSHAGPKVWNELPTELQDLTDHSAFRRQLKTFLFERAFSTQWWSCRWSPGCKPWIVCIVESCMLFLRKRTEQNDNERSKQKSTFPKSHEIHSHFAVYLLISFMALNGIFANLNQDR